jgi:hypothetical protein
MSCATYRNVSRQPRMNTRTSANPNRISSHFIPIFCSHHAHAMAMSLKGANGSMAS